MANDRHPPLLGTARPRTAAKIACVELWVEVLPGGAMAG